MKVSLYIEKSNFDGFFTWLNRLSSGVLVECPVYYTHKRGDIKDPLQLYLSPDEYCLIQDSESNLRDIRETWGDLDIRYETRPLDEEKVQMNDILRNAHRYDMSVEIVNTAIELAMQIPGITPLESLVIAEKEWLYVGKTHHA